MVRLGLSRIKKNAEVNTFSVYILGHTYFYLQVFQVYHRQPLHCLVSLLKLLLHFAQIRTKTNKYDINNRYFE
jgi:hypothetical protein